MRLYSMPSSGNSYKVRLLLALLGQDYETIDVEDNSSELETAKAAGRLPFGKAPVLHLDDGRMLPESNAILLWLGAETPFVPKDKFAYAEMLAWMFWEQNQHEGVIAVRGSLNFYPSRRSMATPERMADLLERGHTLLAIMEKRLAGQDWLVGDQISLADICLYGYTHTAGTRGGFDMAQFPDIIAWLDRIKAIPGYIGIDE